MQAIIHYVPLHIKAEPGSVSDKIIVSDSVDIVKELSRLFNGSLVNDNRGFFVYTGSYKGVRVSTAYHGIGGPSETLVLEELAQLGAKRIVAIEHSVASYIKRYPVVISSSASYMEGGAIGEYVARQGIVMSAIPDFRLLMSLDDAFNKKGVNHTVGPTLSIDTLNYKKSGKYRFLCADLHCAALYILSQIRGFESACVLLQGKRAPKKLIADIETSVSDAIIAD